MREEKNRESFTKKATLSSSLSMKESSAEGNTVCRGIDVEVPDRFGE